MKNAKGGRILAGLWVCGLREGLWDRELREAVLRQGQRWRGLRSLDFAGPWGASWMIYAIERHGGLLGVSVICLWREGEDLG